MPPTIFSSYNIYKFIGKVNSSMQTSRRILNAALHSHVWNSSRPCKHVSLQWSSNRTKCYQHRNSRRPTETKSLAAKHRHRHKGPRQRGTIIIHPSTLLSPYLSQYKGSASYDLTFTMEDQISASEVNGLGYGAKERRAAHRELVIRRKLGGMSISKTIKRRLQR